MHTAHDHWRRGWKRLFPSPQWHVLHCAHNQAPFQLTRLLANQLHHFSFDKLTRRASSTAKSPFSPRRVRSKRRVERARWNCTCSLSVWNEKNKLFSFFCLFSRKLLSVDPVNSHWDRKTNANLVGLITDRLIMTSLFFLKKSIINSINLFNSDLTQEISSITTLVKRAAWSKLKALIHF